MLCIVIGKIEFLNTDTTPFSFFPRIRRFLTQYLFVYF